MERERLDRCVQCAGSDGRSRTRKPCASRRASRSRRVCVATETKRVYASGWSPTSRATTCRPWNRTARSPAIAASPCVARGRDLALRPPRSSPSRSPCTPRSAASSPRHCSNATRYDARRGSPRSSRPVRDRDEVVPRSGSRSRATIETSATPRAGRASRRPGPASAAFDRQDAVGDRSRRPFAWMTSRRCRRRGAPWRYEGTAAPPPAALCAPAPPAYATVVIRRGIAPKPSRAERGAAPAALRCNPFGREGSAGGGGERWTTSAPTRTVSAQACVIGQCRHTALPCQVAFKSTDFGSLAVWRVVPSDRPVYPGFMVRATAASFFLFFAARERAR